MALPSRCEGKRDEEHTPLCRREQQTRAYVAYRHYFAEHRMVCPSFLVNNGCSDHSVSIIISVSCLQTMFCFARVGVRSKQPDKAQKGFGANVKVQVTQKQPNKMSVT